MPDEPTEHPTEHPTEQPTEQPEGHAGEEQSGRDRLRRALMKPSRGQVIVAVLLALLGYAAVTQVRFTNVDNTYAGLREQDLISVLKGLADATQRAESEIARLESTRNDLQSATGKRQAALAEAQQRADTLAIMAGRVPVTGPGVRITITEEDGTVDVDSMVDMVQELRTAGAEAMQVDGKVRVVATTSFDDVVGGIAVDGVQVTSPYVVDVIGDPDTLAGAVNFPNGPRDQFEDSGATVKVDKRGEMVVESVVKPVRAEYAQPASGQ